MLTITNVGRIIFHLEDIIDVESFRIRSAVDIIKEWLQVKEVFMEHLNNFNVIYVIQSFTALLKSKDFFLRYSTLSILNARSRSLFIWTKESSLLYHVHKAYHYIILVVSTSVVNKNSNLRNLMVPTVWFIKVTLVIDPTKEARGNVLHPLLSFKFSPSINLTDVIIIIMNTQAINIFRW